jgi:hypothetical protein
MEDIELATRALDLVDKMVKVADGQKILIDKLMAANAVLSEALTLIQMELDIGEALDD